MHGDEEPHQRAVQEYRCGQTKAGDRTFYAGIVQSHLGEIAHQAGDSPAQSTEKDQPEGPTRLGTAGKFSSDGKWQELAQGCDHQ